MRRSESSRKFSGPISCFEPKQFYLGDLTATFVNRNTAGTFLGVALLLNFALLFADLRNVHLSPLAHRGQWIRPSAALLFHLFAVLDCAAALSLTRSRGAMRDAGRRLVCNRDDGGPGN